MKRAFVGQFALLLCLSISTAAMGAVEVKTPDRGPFWEPVGNAAITTQVYADSFVAPTTGQATSLGTWLVDASRFGYPAGGSPIHLDIYGSLGGNPANGPDISNLLATTGSFVPPDFTSLTFISEAAISSVTFTAGQVYWFGISTIGESGPPTGAWQVGGHTPGAGGSDPGTFWYSNSPPVFDGQGLTPEMAFEVDFSDGTSTVPEPTTIVVWSVLGVVFGGYSWRRNRR